MDNHEVTACGYRQIHFIAVIQLAQCQRTSGGRQSDRLRFVFEGAVWSFEDEQEVAQIVNLRPGARISPQTPTSRGLRYIVDTDHHIREAICTIDLTDSHRGRPAWQCDFICVAEMALPISR